MKGSKIRFFQSSEREVCRARCNLSVPAVYSDAVGFATLLSKHQAIYCFVTCSMPADQGNQSIVFEVSFESSDMRMIPKGLQQVV